MERCKTLINRLSEQSDANADPSAMLVTVQLLYAELNRMISTEPARKSGSGISVVLPSINKTFAIPENREDEAADISTVAAPLVTVEAVRNEDLRRIPEETAQTLLEGIIFPVAEQPGNKEVWVLDPVLETPTLAHQDEIKEINEKIGKLGGESLNDKLKSARSEISSFLTDAPVRELKKAIGINDRFLFINELFRGDVDMYERSIKTINNFRILAEAEYWMERELKIKLAWDNASETAQHFYQLVKRRFS